MTDGELVSRMINREGGSKYTHYPESGDPPTRWGVTLPTLQEWRGNSALTAEDVKALERAEAEAIYHARYLEPFAAISDPALRELLFDSAVQHGVGMAVKLLQRALGVIDDGVLGPITLGALESATGSLGNAGVYRLVCGQRIRYYGQILSAFPGKVKFAAGWCSRIAGFVERGA